MRKKQLFALLMASALSVGMAPTAAFATDTAVEAEGNVEGELDAADTETPAEDPAETPADETPAEDPAAEDPAETPADETPAEDPAETPAAEKTDAQAAEAGDAAIVVGETSYTTLAEAFAAIADSADMTGEPDYIKVKGDIEINATIDVPANKNIMLVAAEDSTIKRAAGFTDSMFTVSGGNLQMAGGSITDSTGATIGAGSLTVDGTGDGVTGSIVEVTSGNYALSDGVTLTGNVTTGIGGAINNAAGANVYLMGGTITGNSASSGAGIYSEGTVNIQGTVIVTGNTVTNSMPEAASNVVLDKDGVINVTGAVTGSTIGVAVQEAAAGRTVVKLADGISEEVQLADVLSQITYEGSSDYKIGEDGTLVSNAEEPTPTPSPDVVVKAIGMKWTGHNSVQITFQSNVKGTYYIEQVKRGEKAPTIDTSKKGNEIDADINVTRKVTKLPEHEVDIYVCVVSEDGKHSAVMFQPITAERPAAPVTVTPTPTPSHTAVVPNVNESVVQGFENALVFYPNTFYDFTVIGAGTQNSNPGEGDVRWVPVYWSMSTNPGEKDKHTAWKIGATGGIYTDTEKTYNIYVFFRKDVYTGSDWDKTEVYEMATYQFKAAPLTKATVTPADGTNGNGSGTGDGTTDGTTDVTPTTYADGTNDTSKSAVATGDESPIGTMMALAAASVLAGGYVLVRRRKKEQ